VMPADQAPTSAGNKPKTLEIAKPTMSRHFSTASPLTGHIPDLTRSTRMTHFGLVDFSCLLVNTIVTGADGSPHRSEKLTVYCDAQRIFGMEYDVNKPFHPKRFIHPPRVQQGRSGRAEFA
jgi:hypothetical protein